MNAWMMSRSASVSGRPPRIASMLAGKLACAGVCRQSWLSTTSGVASRLRSITTRTPLAVGFVADVGDALDPLVLGRVGDLLDQAGLADLVGDAR